MLLTPAALLMRAKRAREAEQQRVQKSSTLVGLLEEPRLTFQRDIAPPSGSLQSAGAAAPKDVAELRQSALQTAAPPPTTPFWWASNPSVGADARASNALLDAARGQGIESSSQPSSGLSLFDFSRRNDTRGMPVALLAGVSANMSTHKATPDPTLAPKARASLSSPGLDKEGDKGSFQSPPSESSLVSMVSGRFYVPLSQSKRKASSSASRKAALTSPAYSLSRDEQRMHIPSGVNRSRPGIIHPDDEPPEPPVSSREQRERQEHNEVERTLSIFTLNMAQSLLPYSDAERNQMHASGAHMSEDDEAKRVRSFLADKAKRHLASMSNARRALLALYDYASHIGITLGNFKASVGLISAFLSSQVARTMAASRLRGLIWAQHNYTIDIVADHASLKSYLERLGSGSGHAETMPVKIACHLAVIASDKQQPEYTRSLAGGLYLLATASLRWADAQRSTWRVLSGTLEGSGQTKTGFAYWWGEKHDLLGGSDWYRPLIKSYKHLASPPDFIFRKAEFVRGKTGSLDGFINWGEGPARKSHVVSGFVELLQMEPLALSLEMAKKYSRIHGARRLFPTLGRYLSASLALSIDDRQELGRWAPSSGGSSSHAAPMANLYASDAQRARCVATRKRVADATRNRIRDVGWVNLPLDGGGFESFINGGVGIADPEPPLSSDESGDEAEIEI